MSRILLAAILALWPGLAGAAAWGLDPGTRVAVDVTWAGGRTEVRFPMLSGTIEFDERRPEAARARIVVDARAATTGFPIADSLMQTGDYLGSDRWPEIVFELDSLRQTSRSTADIEGRITLRGVTRPITFQATVVRYGPMQDDPSRFEAGFDLTGEIDRREFGSTGGIPDVAAELPIRIRLLMSSR
jgi:polyisoprenoid-binding protein YceI